MCWSHCKFEDCSCILRKLQHFCNFEKWLTLRKIKQISVLNLNSNYVKKKTEVTSYVWFVSSVQSRSQVYTHRNNCCSEYLKRHFPQSAFSEYLCPEKRTVLHKSGISSSRGYIIWSSNLGFITFLWSLYKIHRVQSLYICFKFCASTRRHLLGDEIKRLTSPLILCAYFYWIVLSWILQGKVYMTLFEIFMVIVISVTWVKGIGELSVFCEIFILGVSIPWMGTFIAQHNLWCSQKGWQDQQQLLLRNILSVSSLHTLRLHISKTSLSSWGLISPFKFTRK